jgi:hypothetical protein
MLNGWRIANGQLSSRVGIFSIREKKYRIKPVHGEMWVRSYFCGIKVFGYDQPHHEVGLVGCRK